MSGTEHPYESTVLSIPRGAKKKLSAYLRDKGYTKFTFEKHLPVLTPLSRPIKLTSDLRSYQVEAVDAAIEAKHGVICSPPRSGKTVMGAAIVAKLGYKALIIASQRDWLNNFKETFLGSDTQEKFTNAKPSQVGFASSIEDFKKFDVCLATPQQFMSDSGKKKLEAIKDMFPIVIIDEVHGIPALQTARVISRFNTHYTIGLSGTPDRKAGDYIIADDLVGPVCYKANIERLRPVVNVIRPPGKYEIGQNGFTFLISKLENNTPRRNFIVKEAIRRAEQGHLVLIPLTRVNAILNYVRDINAAMGPKYALPFYGGLKGDQRKSFIEDARNYKSRIVVGNISLLSTGLNIPRASCLFEVGVNSNLPKAEQRFSRILTPLEGKPTPTIVFVLDDCDVMAKTRRTEYWNCLKPVFNPIVPPEVQAELNSYFSSKKKNQHDLGDYRNGV
jgi:superfamily II DNA or RNA helicase